METEQVLAQHIRIRLGIRFGERLPEVGGYYPREVSLTLAKTNGVIEPVRKIKMSADAFCVDSDDRSTRHECSH